jgi:peptidoglycan/xylan/chitin deacetylase (PgdA/CDA1 family)
MSKVQKKIKIFLAALIIVCIVVSSWLSSNYVVPIMMYHQVAQVSKEPLNTISPSNFEKHMAYLKTHGYNVITLDKLIDQKSRHKAQAKEVVITFDDGFENIYTNAYPILKKYGFKATIFVITNYIDKEEFLKESQIKEMLSSGLIQVESHTRNHSYLPDIKDESRLWEEILSSKLDLENRFKIAVFFLSYPVGGFDEKIKGMVAKAGYQAALTTNRGFDKANKDLYELKRVRFNNKDYDRSLWIKLSGFYNFFKSSKNPS